MRLIDSHCHLNYAGLAERQEEVLANARARGVAGFLNISTRQGEWGDVLGAAERNADDADEDEEVHHRVAHGVRRARGKQVPGRDRPRLFVRDFGHP